MVNVTFSIFYAIFGTILFSTYTFKILPNLEVYPCEYLTGNHKFLIGKIGEYIDLNKSKELAKQIFLYIGNNYVNILLQFVGIAVIWLLGIYVFNCEKRDTKSFNK